jgi:hypothetical protein
MGLDVDADGKVHETGGSTGGFSPYASDGHVLDEPAVAYGQEHGIDPLSAVMDPIGAAERLAHTMAQEAPRFSIPTGVKVLFGLAAAAVLAMPAVSFLLLFLGGRKVAQGAVAVAPAVAAAGPSVLPFVPEAAPVIAAAALLTAATKKGAGGTPPADTGQHVSTLLGALRTAPPRTAPPPTAPPRPAPPAVSPTVPGAPASDLPSRVEAPAAQILRVLTTGLTAGSPVASSPGQQLGQQLLGALRTMPRLPATAATVDGVPVSVELLPATSRTLASAR